MKQIIAKEIIDLMFLPITNTKVIEIIDALGMEQPSLDEEYEMEGRIWTEGEEESGIAICFVKNKDATISGEPFVEQIDFYDESRVYFPLNLHKNDDYETVVEKIGRKPDFCDKDWDESKQWIFLDKDKEITYCVQFKEGFKSINTIVVGEFNRESVKNSEFLFPCEELKK